MLKTPPLLLGLTLAFWGWQIGFPGVGLVMGALLESARLLKTRWDFSQAELNQLWTLCCLSVLGIATYAYAANEGTSALSGFFNANSFTERSKSMNQGAQAALQFLQWLPFAFYALAAAQAFGRQEKINYQTFSLLFWKSQPTATPRKPQTGGGLHLAWPYFGLCLAGASAIKSDSLTFYGGGCALLAWALWAQRSRRFAAPVWVGLVALALGMGFAGFKGLNYVHALLDNLHAGWLTGFGKKDFDPRESKTSIGRIGKMKLSGTVVMRVEIPPGQPVTPLLRETSYSIFRSPSWIAHARNFSPLIYEPNESSWVFQTGRGYTNTVKVATYLPGGQGLLALPSGVARLDDLPVFQFGTNRYGAAKVESGPGLVLFQARYGPGRTFESPPDDVDLGMPPEELPAIRQIAGELGLEGMTLAQKLKTIGWFFQQKFDYSTWQTEAHLPTTNETVIGRFLLKNRSGHCEFFGTATVLLLRQAGVPARYAAGFSVQEGAGEGRFVVRQRHGHAWALYYDVKDRAWHDFDTTPGSWFSEESKRASFLEPLLDSWSRLWFEFSKLRWGKNNLRAYLFLVMAATIAILGGRFLWQKRWRKSRDAATAKKTAIVWPGLDSEVFAIEQRLVELGLERRGGETTATWWRRIRSNLPPGSPDLQPLLHLHNRYRFDPAGLDAAEREELRRQARAWLAASRPETTHARSGKTGS
jgi:transglutaminase-like putative cysteine protease